MKMRTVIEYILAVVLVLILGGLAGWYFFLRSQTNTLKTEGAAKGFGAAIPLGDPYGSNPDKLDPFPSTGPMQQGTQDGAGGGKSPAQLWQVDAKPVAGELFTGNDNDLRLRYVERATGYVLEADPRTGQVMRLTNTLMPKIYEAFLAETGQIFERSLDTSGNITTFAGTISTTTDGATVSSARSLVGSGLTKNIVSMSAHPESGAIFYILRGPDGAIGVSAEWDGQKQKNIFSSVTVSWRPTVLSDGRIILVQAAADGVPGYAYEIKKDGALSRLLGPVPGLTVRVRPAMEKNAPNALLWGQSVPGALKLFVQTAQDATPVQLPIRTVAEKCVWKPGKELVAYCGVPQGQPAQNFLDEWYRGAMHSADALWRIDAGAGTAELLYTPPSNTPVDIENMVIDDGGNYIAFTNGADKSLWLLRLSK